MNITTDQLWDPLDWAEHTFGNAELGDQRWTRRAVRTAARILRRPSSSLPEQMGARAATEDLIKLWLTEKKAAGEAIVPKLVSD